MRTTESKAAAARVGAVLARRKRAELLGLLRSCSAWTEPWLQVVRVGMAGHHLLIRHHNSTGKLTFHYCYVPEGQLLTKTG